MIGVREREPVGIPVLEQNEYEVLCFNCREQFNALDSVWCNCITSEPTLVCPGCLTCLCKAPMQYRDKLWEEAPQSLWDKLAETSAQNCSPNSNPPAQDVKRPLILIVDTNKNSLCKAFNAATGLGYGAIVAHNGLEGLRLAKEYKPDLILTDTLMPGLDGREMCRLLKESSETSKIKVVIATALYAQNKFKAEAYRMFHVDEYLSKPLSFQELHAVLSKYLD